MSMKQYIVVITASGEQILAEKQATYPHGNYYPDGVYIEIAKAKDNMVEIAKTLQEAYEFKVKNQDFT